LTLRKPHCWARSRPDVAGGLHAPSGEAEVEDSYDLLTPREKEVLQLVAEGRTNKEVANILKLSLYTVESHRGNILEKLNLHSVPELILYAVRKGIIS
jgi:two-component system response regulator NreC